MCGNVRPNTDFFSRPAYITDISPFIAHQYNVTELIDSASGKKITSGAKVKTVAEATVVSRPGSSRDGQLPVSNRVSTSVSVFLDHRRDWCVSGECCVVKMRKSGVEE